MKIFLLLLLSAVLSSSVARAEEEPVHFVPNEHPGMILGLAEFPAYSFYLGAPNINGVAYVPNFSLRLGTQIRWKDYGLVLSFGLPLPPEEIERRGKTEQSYFLITRHWRDSGLDLYYQQYKGFYVASPFTEMDLHKPARYPQLPDATIKNYGMNFYKTLESSRYSMSAAFSQMEVQTVSGGSWLLMGFYNHLEMSIGGTLIQGSDPNSLQTLPNLQTGIFDTAGGGGGYGYTWVYKNWYLTGQGILGLGAQLQHIDQAQGDFSQSWGPAVKINLNISAGRNVDNFLFGGKLLLDSLASDVRGVQVYSTLLNGLLFAGMDF